MQASDEEALDARPNAPKAKGLARPSRPEAPDDSKDDEDSQGDERLQNGAEPSEESVDKEGAGGYLDKESVHG